MCHTLPKSFASMPGQSARAELLLCSLFWPYWCDSLEDCLLPLSDPPALLLLLSLRVFVHLCIRDFIFLHKGHEMSPFTIM